MLNLNPRLDNGLIPSTARAAELNTDLLTPRIGAGSPLAVITVLSISFRVVFWLALYTEEVKLQTFVLV